MLLRLRRHPHPADAVPALEAGREVGQPGRPLRLERGFGTETPSQSFEA